MRKTIMSTMAALMIMVVAIPAMATSDEAMSDQPTIVGLLVDDDQFDNNPRDFDILTEAVIATDLVGALDGGLGFDITVFAPNDRAFRLLVKDLTGTWYSSEEDIFNVVASLGIDTVRDVILYHAIEGEVFAATALGLDGVSVPTLLGPTFTVKVSGHTIGLVDNDPDLRNPRVYAADIDVSNGVVHAIDRVLIPLDL